MGFPIQVNATQEGNFDKVPVGQSKDSTIRLTNTTAELHSYRCSFQGKTATYQIVKAGAGTLKGSASVDVVVRFAPIIEGEDDAIVLVECGEANASEDRFRQVRVFGTGTSPLYFEGPTQTHAWLVDIEPADPT